MVLCLILPTMQEESGKNEGGVHDVANVLLGLAATSRPALNTTLHQPDFEACPWGQPLHLCTNATYFSTT